MFMGIGRLVYDVKTENVGEEKKVLNNRIAITNSKDKTTFIDIVAWDNQAALIGKHFKKGYEILLQGHLINKKKFVKVKDETVEIEIAAIQVDKILFTNGNPKEFTEEPDFLK